MRIHRVFTLGIAVAALAACETRITEPRFASIGGGATNPNIAPLVVSPDTVTISVGSTVQMTASAGSAIQGQLTWASSNTSVATVSPTGQVTAFAPGTTTISATNGNDPRTTGTATVNVISQ